MMQSKNQLFSGVFRVMWEERRGEWVRQLEEYLGEVEIGELRSMSKEKVKLKVHAWDEARWRRELYMKETLELYRNKSKIQEERIYNYSFGSVILFRCLTNTLKLNWRRRYQGREVECNLCGEREEETLDHFLRQCSGLRHKGARHGVREEDELVEMLLFSNQSTMKIEKWRKYLEESWRERVAAVEVGDRG